MSNKRRRRSRYGDSVHGTLTLNDTTGTKVAGDEETTDLVEDHPYNYAKTSAVSLTYTASTDDITRGAGSFVTDGWLAGMKCKISGTANNDKTVTILTVAALTLTLAVGDTLTDETVSSTLTSVNTVPGDNVARAPV